MRISDLINTLQSIQDRSGDLWVEIESTGTLLLQDDVWLVEEDAECEDGNLVPWLKSNAKNGKSVRFERWDA